MTITQRAVEPEDEPLLFAAYAATRAEEMALVPWTEAQREAFLKSQFAAQQADYNRHYLNSEHRIIVANNESVGVSWLDETETELKIIDLVVLPEHRRKGIGSYLLKDFCMRATKVNKQLTVYVENFNPSLRLFESLGFSKVGDEGIYFLMKWSSEHEFE